MILELLLFCVVSFDFEPERELALMMEPRERPLIYGSGM